MNLIYLKSFIVVRERKERDPSSPQMPTMTGAVRLMPGPESDMEQPGVEPACIWDANN